MLDTMDYGLLDHNAFSKWSLGWINPYYVEEETFGGKASITVEVKDLVNYGEAICLPARGREYFGNAFGEYLLLELHSPTDLNAYDAGRHYQSGYPNGYSMPGIRLYHVDARMWGKGQAFGNAYYEGNPADINWGHLGVNPQIPLPCVDQALPNGVGKASQTELHTIPVVDHLRNVTRRGVKMSGMMMTVS